MLIMVCGLPGTGKSFISKKIAEMTGAEWLSSDSIRKRILEKRTYSEQEKNSVYEAMAKEAGKLLDQGKDVIVDATFYLARYRNIIDRTAWKHGCKLYIILCTLDDLEVRKRMEKRKQEKNDSEADFRIYIKIKEGYEPLKEEHLALDTALPLEEMISKITRYVSDKHG